MVRCCRSWRRCASGATRWSRWSAGPPDPKFFAIFGSLSHEEQAVYANREWFGRLCTAALQPAIEDACESLSPDLIVREPCEFASAIAAHRRGIEQVTVACSPAAVEWSSLDLIAPVLPDGLVAFLRAGPYLTRFPASIDPSPFPDTRRYREPAVPRAGSGTHVYATFGSVAGGLGADRYRAPPDAVHGPRRPGPAHDGGATSTSAPYRPTSASSAGCRRTRHSRRPTLVVCHGGSGTVLGALAAGLPLVILPLFADQLVNARTPSRTRAQ